MYLKKDKYSIAAEAGSVAYSSAIMAMRNNMAVGYNTNDHSIMGMLVNLVGEAVRQGVQEGIRVALENVYTEEELEKALTLNN